MLHILLVILKILLFLVAAAVLSVLGILFLLLFVPIRYQISAEKKAVLKMPGKTSEQGKAFLHDVCVHAHIHWFFHIFHLSFSGCGAHTHLLVKVFGYPVIGGKNKTLKKQAEKQSGKENSNPQKEIQDAGRKFQEETGKDRKEENFFIKKDSGICRNEPSEDIDDFKREGNADIQINKTETPEISDDVLPFPQNIFNKILCLMQKISSKISGIWNRLCRFPDKLRKIQKSWQKIRDSFDSYQKLWYDEHTRGAWRHVKKELRYLLHHYRPRRIDGDILFGLGDPSQTGQVLGALYMIQTFLGNHFIFEADFEEQRLEGNIFVKGHIRLWHLIKTALALFFDSHVRITVKRFRKMQERT